MEGRKMILELEWLNSKVKAKQSFFNFKGC